MYDRNEVLKNGTKVKKGEENYGSELLQKQGDEFAEMMYDTSKEDIKKMRKKFDELKSKS